MEPSEPPETVRTSNPRSHGPTRRALFAAAALIACLWGVRNLYPHEKSSLDDLTFLAMAYVLGWWAVADARRRGNPVPMLSRHWFFLCPIFVPAYAIWCRGWRGLGWVTLLGIGWYVLVTASMFAAYYAIRALQVA